MLVKSINILMLVKSINILMLVKSTKTNIKLYENIMINRSSRLTL